MHMASRIRTGLKSIPVEQIDSTDFFYSHPAREASPSESLRRSISLCGIVSPLVLEEIGPGGFRIVDGFRRLRVACDLGYSEVPGLAAEGGPADQFLLALTLNSTQRILSELETAELVVRLKQDFEFSSERITTEISPLVGSALQGETLSRLCRLGSLPAALKAGTRGRLTLNAALSLSTWPEEDWALFLQIVDELKIGPNKQRELVELLGELSRREDAGVATIWEQSGAGRIAASESLSPADRFRGAKAALFRLRFPTLSSHEARFQELKSLMKLPQGIDVRVPPFFEGDRLEITLRPVSGEELRRALEKIGSEPVLSRFEEIFGML